jgi:hypothetical protein
LILAATLALPSRIEGPVSNRPVKHHRQEPIPTVDKSNQKKKDKMPSLDTRHHQRSREPGESLLSPAGYDDDASSIHSRSEQDSDSDDDELQLRARNSRELRAADRIVLMEEEELDRLVTDSRRRQERQRRGSGLGVPNPLRMLARKGSSGSLRRGSVNRSAEDQGLQLQLQYEK